MWSSMPFYKAFYLLFFLALISQIGTCEKYSAWMLESIISRGEGISATDGLLGEIQKVYLKHPTHLLLELPSFLLSSFATAADG